MRKYFYLIFTFTLIWLFISYSLFLIPRIDAHNHKVSIISPEFYLYTFVDTAPKPIKKPIKTSQKNILFDLTFEQQVFKNSFKNFLATHWNKFIQYNEHQFCLLQTNKESSSIEFEYCNNNLFKRSIELAIKEISTSDLFLIVDADFIFKINSIELKELFNEKDSSYINYDISNHSD